MLARYCSRLFPREITLFSDVQGLEVRHALRHQRRILFGGLDSGRCGFCSKQVVARSQNWSAHGRFRCESAPVVGYVHAGTDDIILRAAADTLGCQIGWVRYIVQANFLPFLTGPEVKLRFLQHLRFVMQGGFEHLAKCGQPTDFAASSNFGGPQRRFTKSF